MSNIGRNDPCPCGSNKKYKKCCLLIKDQQQQTQRIQHQEFMKKMDLEWENWWKQDQALGQQRIQEATANMIQVLESPMETEYHRQASIEDAKPEYRCDEDCNRFLTCQTGGYNDICSNFELKPHLRTQE